MSVTYARGFTAAGVAAGLKNSGAQDVALVVNAGPLDTASAVFTENRIQAAPVLWSRQAIADGQAQAVILNSGGANACTGPQGFADTHHTAEHVAQVLDISPGDVLVCSTGLIGERLPMDRLITGINDASTKLHDTGGLDAAHAIMTTDSVPKTATATSNGWRVGGMAKGAGMLAPALATMLCVITTDATIDATTAHAALREATRTTFDRIDSDGCMSTNDTVILLASGASEITPTAQEFTEALTSVCAHLARQLIADAEGASHDIAVTVRGASTQEAALAVARSITRSNLLKAAIFGNDPNWGRVLAALGTVPVSVAPYEPDDVDVTINGVTVCRGGGVGEDRALVDLAANRDVDIVVDLHAGDESVTIWTNDLTHDYVHENSAYST
ncbi:bifunctional glutamate N-acetyltransferase/amino-acid acetyltransferase ArgJ [Jonesia quinghaiensis]|uniref:bifunctional glutamate N-acetyltransferase/amino-acid acetyltransferase ArgJ n=1 Tax=Jonesia quinghaiensis TaxID=262806 RepID=UPI00040604F6|nr:bifunctional glutamate N-acetyltransferase/amino-acid acetyltransferase ArgJ [Jonesia quinghaiensis]